MRTRLRKVRKLFAGVAAAILTAGSCTSCSENNIPKEHIGIPAAYEDSLFEKGKLNEIQINMENWDAFVQKTMETKISGSYEQQLQEKEYESCNSPTVILLHGGGLSWWNYRDIAETLKDEYHMILPILDGHAGSDRNFTAIEENAREMPI